MLCLTSARTLPTSWKVSRRLTRKVTAEIWHKADDHPNNRHPYPVINPDTQEMAFAYYDVLSGWQFDRDYNPGRNMLWMDVEKILPKKED